MLACNSILAPTNLERSTTRLSPSADPAPEHALNRDAEALGRRISLRVVDVGGAATGWTESGLARANEQIDDDDQKIPGWHPNQLL